MKEYKVGNLYVLEVNFDDDMYCKMTLNQVQDICNKITSKIETTDTFLVLPDTAHLKIWDLKTLKHGFDSREFLKKYPEVTIKRDELLFMESIKIGDEYRRS